MKAISDAGTPQADEFVPDPAIGGEAAGFFDR